MVRHIVFFKHSAFESLKEELVEKLTSLKDEIEYIVGLEVGTDFICSERSFNAALTVTLSDRKDLAKYANDPKHMPVVEWIKSNGFETKVVDYEF